MVNFVLGHKIAFRTNENKEQNSAFLLGKRHNGGSDNSQNKPEQKQNVQMACNHDLGTKNPRTKTAFCSGNREQDFCTIQKTKKPGHRPVKVQSPGF